MTDPATKTATLWHRPTWLAAMLVVACAAVYFNSLGGAFVFDDNHHIAYDYSIRSLTDLPAVLAGTSRPVVKLTLAVNFALSGDDARSYHLLNIVIHIAAGLLLFGIVRRTLLTEPLRQRYEQSASWLAFAVSLIWLIHPLQTQSVTYVIQRSESLMGLFYLLTLYSTLRCAGSGHSFRWGALAVVACGLGMMTKEVMVTAPIVVLLYDRTFLAGSFNVALRRRWGLYGCLAMTWIALWVVMGGMGRLTDAGASAGFSMGDIGGWEYLGSQPRVILHYLQLSVWPHPLCLDYGWPVARGALEIVGPSLVVGALLVAAVVAVWRRPAIGFVGAWFFLILAPTSSIMPIRDLAVEHRMYLSLASFVVVVVFVADRAVARLAHARNRLAVPALVAVALALGAATVMRNNVYHHAVELWRSVVAVAPNNSRAYENLGVQLAKAGQHDQSITMQLKAIELNPHAAKAHNSLGVSLQNKGQTEQAIHYFRQALHLRPTLIDAHHNLATALDDQGKSAEALRHYQRVIELRPAFFNTRLALGVKLQQQGQLDSAIDHLRQAVKSNPNSVAAHYHLGVSLALQGRYDQAIEYLQQTVRLAPDHAPAHNNLGTALQRVGRFDEAADHYRRALEIDPDYADARANLNELLQRLNE